MDNMLKDFLVESYENLDQVDQDFVALEQTPDDLETLASIFRTIHTIKGSCGFFGYSRLESLAHTGENLLGLLREGQLSIDDPITSALLDMIDHIRSALADIEKDGQEGERDFSSVIATLQRLQTGDSATADAPPEAEPVAPSPAADVASTAVAPAGDPVAESVEDDIVRQFLADSYACLERMDNGFLSLAANPSAEVLAELAEAAKTLGDGCTFMGLDGLVCAVEEAAELLKELQAEPQGYGTEQESTLVDLAAAVGEALASIEATGEVGNDDLGELQRRLRDLRSTVLQPAPQPTLQPPPAVQPTATPTSSPPDDPAEPIAQQSAAPLAPESAPAGDARSNIADTTIRVDVGLLDRLMNQVGELVLQRNQILQRSGESQDKEFANMVQGLSHITSELQESIMLTRLQPIDTIWGKLPRVIRNLSKEVGKQIHLEMQGGDTELDKTLVEAIKDPMTHLVRNAVDHGIEFPEERVAFGKKAKGTVTLRAYHEGGQVNIEISDDGKGIDGDKVLEKVLQKGLLDAEQARHLSEHDKLGLIFMPGLSTAEQVTNISGRGVGMDVVKSNIDRINGLIDIHSEAGRGTHIKLKIPLTLAIIPALMVGCANERYAIPQMSLISVVSPELARAGIEILHHVPVYRWRGTLLPLVHLRDELKLGRRGEAQESPLSIIVLQAENRQFGLIVDEVFDTEEIVVKPLGSHLRSIPIYAGATIRGDGMAALILDVLGLAQSAAVVSELGGAEFGLMAEEEKTLDFDKQMVLLVRHQNTRLAIPISRVPRLETFPSDSVEYSGDAPVVQYRGSILRLKCLQEGSTIPENDGMVNVVVCTEGQGPIGLVVDEILDIVEERFSIQRNGNLAAGVLGTAVIQEKVVEVLDVDTLTVPV